MMKKSMYGVLVLLAASGACLAQSGQPSLGDLAKQSKAEKKPARVFTNEDVATTHSDAPRQQASVPASSSSAAATGESKPEKKPEKKSDSAGKEAAATKDPPEVAELKQKISAFKEEQEGWKSSA